MDMEARVNRIETRLNHLEDKFNDAIPDIQSGIREIKVMLQERPVQEDLKNSLLHKDIESHETRLKKIEDNQTWLWRTFAGSIITLVISAIVFVVKMM